MLDALVAVCGLWSTYVECNMPLYANAFTATLSAEEQQVADYRSEILLRSAQNSMYLNIGKAHPLKR
jgi:hypothetical protein